MLPWNLVKLTLELSHSGLYYVVFVAKIQDSFTIKMVIKKKKKAGDIL